LQSPHTVCVHRRSGPSCHLTGHYITDEASEGFVGTLGFPSSRVVPFPPSPACARSPHHHHRSLAPALPGTSDTSWQVADQFGVKGHGFADADHVWHLTTGEYQQLSRGHRLGRSAWGQPHLPPQFYCADRLWLSCCNEVASDLARHGPAGQQQQHSQPRLLHAMLK
jgi:hypothetical protein